VLQTRNIGQFYKLSPALLDKMPLRNSVLERNMDFVGFEAAKFLVLAKAVSHAEIRCVDGQRWAIFLHGGSEFVLKSERQSPRRFALLETAMEEVRRLGLIRCEVNLEQWHGKSARPASAP
jgi:hypothetical protein